MLESNGNSEAEARATYLDRLRGKLMDVYSVLEAAPNDLTLEAAMRYVAVFNRICEAHMAERMPVPTEEEQRREKAGGLISPN